MTVLAQPRVLGRYLVYASIASGGMATVYLGRMAGPKGFSRIIAIKQLHAQFVNDTDFVTMFLDEAHLIGRIHHSNVVAPIDVVEADGDLCIIMEYVHGEAVGRLMRLSRQDRIPLRVVTAIMVQTLLGLHAAHEVTDGDGKPLAIVHRDVSPQNILVGEDGITRVVDFGIAKAAHLTRSSDTSKLKGKLGYMAPEQFLGGEVDRRCDIFSAGIILWEMLTGKKLFAPTDLAEATERAKQFEPRAPSTIVPTISPELDAISLKALAVDPNERFATAHDMARALEAACAPASAIEVAEWMKPLVGDTLSTRATWIQELVSLDLSEWTQTYAISPSSPPPANPGASDGQANSKSVPPPNAGATGAIASNERGAPVLPNPRRNGSFYRIVALSVLLLAMGAAASTWWHREQARLVHQRTNVFAASPSPSEVVNLEGPSISEPSPNTSIESTSTEAKSVVSADAATDGKSPLTSSEEVSHTEASAKYQSSAASRPVGSGSRADCRIPYVIDTKGIKRFRPECFR